MLKSCVLLVVKETTKLHTSHSMTTYGFSMVDLSLTWPVFIHLNWSIFQVECQLYSYIWIDQYFRLNVTLAWTKSTYLIEWRCLLLQCPQAYGVVRPQTCLQANAVVRPLPCLQAYEVVIRYLQAYDMVIPHSTMSIGLWVGGLQAYVVVITMPCL